MADWNICLNIRGMTSFERIVYDAWTDTSLQIQEMILWDYTIYEVFKRKKKLSE